MTSVEVTTVSAKGQVVIPDAIRRALGISEGAKFAVVGTDDSIVFKRLSVPSAKQLFAEIRRTARIFAKAKGLKEKDASKRIHEGRGVGG